MSNVPGLIDPRTPKRLVGCELVNLAARDPRRLVELSERQYAGRIRAAADQILSTGRHIVMVTGPSAAGKTTSSRKLADELRRRGVRSEVLSLDDFFVGAGRYPKLPDGSDDYECVEALDLPVLHKCLQSLAETGECDAPVFDFLTQLPTGEKRHINCSGGVAIVEGLHAFNPALTAPLPEGAVLNIYASLREETLCANSFLRTDFDVAILKDIEYEIRSEVRSVSRERAKRWEAIERTDNLDYRNSVYP